MSKIILLNVAVYMGHFHPLCIVELRQYVWKWRWCLLLFHFWLACQLLYPVCKKHFATLRTAIVVNGIQKVVVVLRLKLLIMKQISTSVDNKSNEMLWCIIHVDDGDYFTVKEDDGLVRNVKPLSLKDPNWSLGYRTISVKVSDFFCCGYSFAYFTVWFSL